MKAVAYSHAGSIDEDNALTDISLDKPVAGGHDLLIKVEAVSVNPVDTKLRRNRHPVSGEWAVLGFDAAGVVEATGELVTGFKPGDKVFYAGTLNRPGTNCEYHLVDARIVGHQPKSLTAAEAAALPLTAITAWEMLFDRLDVNKPTAQGSKLILVIGGSGGVGSITIQLLRALTDITVVATASRAETQAWVKQCGAQYVIDHRQPLTAQFEALGLGAPGFVFSTTQTDQHYADIVKLIAPQGRFGLIDDPGDLSIMPFKQKAVSVHWEFMFTRPEFVTPDMATQGSLLNEVAALVDQGVISSTLTTDSGKINAENMIKAHRMIESGTAKGKIVLSGFD